MAPWWEWVRAFKRGTKALLWVFVVYLLAFNAVMFLDGLDAKQESVAESTTLE